MGGNRTRAANLAAAAKAAQAVELRRGRVTYAVIAQQLGYSTAAAAWKAVDGALRRNEAGQVDALRAEETDMLDRLHFAFWRAALNADVDAGKMILAISTRRARLLGLDAALRVKAELTDETREKVHDLVGKIRALPPAPAEPAPVARRRRTA